MAAIEMRPPRLPQAVCDRLDLRSFLVPLTKDWTPGDQNRWIRRRGDEPREYSCVIGEWNRLKTSPRLRMTAIRSLSTYSSP